MKKIALLFIFIAFVSCQQKENPASETIQQELIYEVVTADAFADYIQGKDIQLLDVRTKKEFDGGHIKGAAHHHIYDKDFKEQLRYLDKEKPVYVYCKSGGRSEEAALELKEMGFKKIYDLKGGISSWKGEVE